MLRPHPPRVAIFALLLCAGCSNYALPHHAYTPLFAQAGQIDVTASAGVYAGTGHPELTVEGRAAGSPADGLVLAGGVTGSVIPGERSSNHVDGELALGAYLPRERNVRAEVLAGSAVGYGTGFFSGEDGDALLSGPYVRPFVQGAVAGVTNDGFFTCGGGLRIASTMAELDVDEAADFDASYAQAGFRYQVHFDPFFLARFGDDTVNLGLGFGTSVSPIGDEEIGSRLSIWFDLALHLRFDVFAPASP